MSKVIVYGFVSKVLDVSCDADLSRELEYFQDLPVGSVLSVDGLTIVKLGDVD